MITKGGDLIFMKSVIRLVFVQGLFLIFYLGFKWFRADSLRLRPFLPNKIQNLVFFPRDDFMRTQNKKREGDSFS